MKRCSRTLRYSSLPHGIKGLFVALLCVAALFGCGGGGENNTVVQQLPAPTTGSLNVNVTPASAQVVVTGPASFTENPTGNQFLADLPAGRYTAQASAPGFADASGQIDVVAGQTSRLALVLRATSIISDAPRAVYRDGQGNLIPLGPLSPQSGQFVFYAWLRNLPSGTLPGSLTSATVRDPGKPLLAEQTDSAPSFTQSLAGAWVGFKDPAGVVRPVIGADVRWEIDRIWSGRVNSMQFGTSDDNGSALGYGIVNAPADTRTNNARLAAERFPLIASEYPLFNLTGIGTPFIDGFTWVTLFSPDKVAAGRIVAVATVNGEEIGKQIMYNSFEPAPPLQAIKSFELAPPFQITKTVAPAVVNLVGGTATATWTVTVKNVGIDDATSVDLTDILASGPGASYTLAALPLGSVPAGDGFTYSFPLASGSTPPPDQTAQLLGNAQSFAVLANTAVTNTGSSVVSGNVGLSPGSAITGFPPGITLNGTIHSSDAPAIAAQTALTTAYTDLAARACTADLTGQDLGGMTLVPGVYCFSSTAQLTGPLVLNAQGISAAEFVFKIGSTLTTASGSSVSLINDANPCNVYWQVGSSATLGASTFFAGNILAQASVTAVTGASISGRALARTGAITLDTNAITAPLSCVAAPPAPSSTKTLTFTATVTAPGTYCNESQISSYSSATGTFTPVDLKAQACFTALQSNVSIVKDFVAADNTTSLGKALTVAANVPAKLRVRVINSGTGAATGVSVSDALNGGALAAYTLSSVAPGTPNTSDGFDNTIGTIAAGTTSTTLLTVVASADGQYCDTATVTAAPGTNLGIVSDGACLTVSTPSLTITKTDAPASVLPGATYTSTIVVNNTGSATAKDVKISDRLGLNSADNVRAIYVSSSLNGLGGTLTADVVTANTVDIPVGGSLTFTVVSRIPLNAISGTYCDMATVTSSNIATTEAQACIAVPAFSALQTQLVDNQDPIVAGSNINFFSVIYAEALSNEGVKNNTLTYSFGLVSPAAIGTEGVFQLASTRLYLDTKPVQDPITGLIVSGAPNATAVLLAEGSDYTLNNSTPGLQLITMTPSFQLQPGTALYAEHVVLVPSGTVPGKMYTTSYIWSSTGLFSTSTYQASSSEPTTVFP